MDQESLVLKMPLTEEEQIDLARREEYIEENLQTLFSVGKAFADIRDRKLYRESHRTFEDYCRDRWKISRPRAYQLIDASVVQENVSTNVDKKLPLPTNEAQTRALKKVAPDKQPELWEKAVKQNDGHAPTGKQIIQVIETEFEEKKPKYVPQIDPNIERNLPPKPTPTQSQLKTIIKAFMGVEFADFTEAFQELGHLCNCWQSRQPYIELVNRLKTTIEFSYTLPEFHFTVLNACRAAYDDWNELYNSDYRGALEPEEPKETEDERYVRLLSQKEEEKQDAEPVTGPLQHHTHGASICVFCGEQLPPEKLYQSELHSIASYPAGIQKAAICRKCATKAQVDLLQRIYEGKEYDR